MLLLSAQVGFASPLRTTIEVGVDGGPSSGRRSEIPYDSSQIRFEVKPRPGFIRHRLVGYETDWSERTGEMYFLVRFLDSTGDQIAQQSFLVKGKSTGWKGSEANSAATDRRESIVVPPDARNVAVTISSAGPAAAVGIFAISHLNVTARNDAAAPRVLIGADVSTDWAKGGTRPSMASLRHDREGTPVYCITDDDVNGHADWKTVVNPSSRISPGETLEFTWKEVFCTGMGDPFKVQYGKLPPGDYRFEVESLGISGISPDGLAVFEVRVASPYWRNPWYLAAFLLGAAGISTLVARHLVRKKIQMHLREARMIADERLRIARDLHDDLGARLSHISLLGAHAMSTAPTPEAMRNFGEIASMSRELVTSLSESVWMLNSKNDRLGSLTDYLCRMVGGLCRPLDISCRIDAPPPADEDLPVTGELRHNVTMAVKEAVNNALKHSEATEIRLKVDADDRDLEIRVSDNGKGLHEPIGAGNGLENIRQRMNQIGGSVEIGTNGGCGTAILLRAPLEHKAVRKAPYP
ncbi:ATP-binding protein [Luteolibacter sp. SL250]|uniref:sensor histidine kinase n=1 Tax=Luteolibacter sp. SL250 TaxID=2995170 RepID=UPI002270D639|nr:ATP-binding protein [Luteolibacter sp. SL250]WAC21889.1 ATP-binding protein [Luteolibacter sp. SL250]